MSAVTEPLSPPQSSQQSGLQPGLHSDVPRDPKTGRLMKKPKQHLPPPNPRTDNEPGIPARLAVYRWISEQPKHCDDTDRKKQMRTWAEANPVRFEDKLSALEDEWAARAAPAGNEPTPVAEAPFPELEEAWAEFQEWSRAKNN